MHQPHAAKIGGRRKSGHVADHSAAHRDENGVPVGARLHQRTRDSLDGREAFRCSR